MIELLYKIFDYFDTYISTIINITALCITAHILAKQYPVYKHDKVHGIVHMLLFIFIYITTSYYDQYKLLKENISNDTNIQSAIDKVYL